MCPFDLMNQYREVFLPVFWPQGLRLVLFAYYAASFILGCVLWREYVERIYFTRWYDISKNGWLGELQWAEVKLLMENDPLNFNKKTNDPLDPDFTKDPRLKKTWRWGPWRQWGRDGLAVVVLVALWGLGMEGIHKLNDHFHPIQIETTVHLIGVLGLLGAAAKAVYEWRLKARTENRQKWINDLRNTLAKLIENMPLKSDPEAKTEAKNEAYFKMHGKLELLMNPSEKDHRGLMALIRHIYGHSKLKIDEVPQKNLGISEMDFEQQKSNVIRLSNIVLKREWERVKHIQ